MKGAFHMMNADDNRGNTLAGNRGIQARFSNDNRGNYSPSASYNFSTRNAAGNYVSPNQNARGKRPKQFPPRPNPSNNNANDRIAKQNDVIIKLLKEIRDRLPPPLESLNPLPPESEATTESFHYGNEHPEETAIQDIQADTDAEDQEEYPVDEADQSQVDRLSNDEQPA
jgi:hypothetical protein